MENEPKTKAKLPFSATKLGIATNTILGIPRELAKKAGKLLPGLGKALEAAEKKDFSVFKDYQKEQFKKDFPPMQVEKDGKMVLNPEALKATETLVAGFTGGGMKNVADDLILKTRGQLVKYFAKEKNPELIKDALIKLKHPAESIDDIAKKLASTENEQEVNKTLGIFREPVQELTSAVKEAQPLRREIANEQSIERAKRFAQAEKVQERVGGEKGYFEGLKKLRGELVEKTPEFTPARDSIAPENINLLYETIRRTPTLLTGEKLTAQRGLLKLLDGHVPVPSELKVLEEAFGSDVVRSVYDRRPLSTKIWDTTWELLADIPRALKTTLDMSATLNQNVMLGIRKPKRGWEAFRAGMKQMLDKDAFSKALDSMQNSPDYLRAKESGLRLSDPRKLFGGKEELFLSNLAEKIPVIGRIVKASNRGYVGLLNNMRYNSFNDYVKALTPEERTPETLKAFADFVNTATGSGGLGTLERSADTMSKILFAPRFISSRVQFFNPFWYAKQPKAVRMEALKSAATFTTTVSSIITMIKLAGGDVETDWRSSNFGKWKVGNRTYDMTFGFGLYVRLLGQLSMGERKTQKGEIQELGGDGPFNDTRLGIAARAARGKLAPVWASAVNLMEGKNLIGEPTSFSNELFESVTPLYVGDLYEALKDQGPEGLFTVGLPAFFGVRIQTRNDNSTKSRLEQARERAKKRRER